jgi:hypothetical protein
VTLASTRPRPSPSPSSLIFSPPSPITPASLPSGVDTDSNAIKFPELQPRGILSDSFNNLFPTSLPFSPGVPAPEPALEPLYRRQPVSLPLSLPGHSPLSRPTSLATGCSTSGYTLDAATRLQDFRALIDELRSTLLHHDSKEEFDTGNYDNDDGDDERERLLRLLEDVMQKVQQLDAPRLGGLSGLSL